MLQSAEEEGIYLPIVQPFIVEPLNVENSARMLLHWPNAFLFNLNGLLQFFFPHKITIDFSKVGGPYGNLLINYEKQA